ncbi:MAG: FAD-dependent oxidoreductase [Clostridia bacterium]|nr:FAD-dependent oxidoreductase [Clostridia bacterium]
MDPKYAPLFQSWQVGKVTIKNRVVMLPMEGTNMIQWEAKTGFVKGIEELYRDRKDQNVGLFIPGLIPLVSIIGEKWVYQHPEVFEPVKPIVREIHESGAKIFFQLSAGSGRSMLLPPLLKPFIKPGLLQKASSKIVMSKWWWSAPDPGEPNVWDPQVKMGHFTSEMISRFVYAFGQTAKLCQEAGVDGVEIHAVHEGYLLDQFAMPYTNHRGDAYGGSLENRLRFACEIVREVKKVCGEDYPVSLRYSVCSMTRGFNQGAVPGEEFDEVGRSLAESERAIRILEEAGYDLFNCDNGTYDAWFWAHPPVYAPLNLNLSYVEHIKSFTSKPVVCAGRMQPDAAAASIAAGRIDAMGVGRQLLCDPEYVTKIKEDRLEEIRPCIACHGACLPFNGLNGKGTDIDPLHVEMGRCVLNPWTNNERKYSLAPTKHPRRIAVIGGGPGGMEVAIQAARRGHQVELFEKTGRLGGAFNAAAAMSFKEKDQELLKWYERELAKSGATVHLNTEITDLAALTAGSATAGTAGLDEAQSAAGQAAPQSVTGQAAPAFNEIVVAIGAQPKHLPVPGAERAVTAVDFLDGKVAAGDRVVIIGGGLTGCEIAYELALQGKHPVIIEMTGNLVGARGICMANSSMLRELLRYHRVPAYLNATVTAIGEDHVAFKTPDGDLSVLADTVILSVGYSPDPRFKPQKGKDRKKTAAAGKTLAATTSAKRATRSRKAASAAEAAPAAPRVHFIGDCDRVGSLKTVIKQAYELVQEISYR